MSDEKKSEGKKDKDMNHYHPKFIPSEDNLKKVEKAFDKSRETSMKGKYTGFVEVK